MRTRAALRAFAVALVAVTAFVGPRAGLAQSAAPSAVPGTSAVPLPASTDPYLWLEDPHAERALTWVRAENAKTLAVLEGDPRFGGVFADALKIEEAKDRLAVPQFLQRQIYNYWQDADHVRGIWRRTSAAEYLKPAPAWQTVLDLDALAKAEKANWVFQGVSCLWPEQTRCLISLSDGGEDAVDGARVRRARAPFRQRRIRPPARQARLRVGKSGRAAGRARVATRAT